MHHHTVTLESRLGGTPRDRLWKELFGNALHFPLVNILLELLLRGAPVYLSKPDAYLLILSGVVQALWLSRRSPDRPWRLTGNLIGPALYTAVEVAMDGAGFFADANHIAYWVFALLIGAIQSLRLRSPRIQGPLLIVEQVVRSCILLAMYAIFEIRSKPIDYDFSDFMSDPSHQFVSVIIPVLGLSLGLAELSSQHYLALLRETAAQLRVYAEWLFGRDLLGRAISDPAELTLARRTRTVLFMDIRGFTRWSEPRPPEAVVAMLNRYYAVAEPLLQSHGAIKVRFLADEVLAVFADADDAAAAASELREKVGALLAGDKLGAGIGLNTGPVVEGLMGSSAMQAYDVIGDTVNTAKRIEGGAAAQEVLISDATRQALSLAHTVGAAREIAAKGKAEPLRVFPLDYLAFRARRYEEARGLTPTSARLR
ncbi:adenylate/guanylate cyclase domain-containing protein [Chloroflexales bacterium ZM16-3]|nr:adenylate/guanylate cyclase domain-containing protein [Chloroflexales bacterium ZM16-3]